MGEKYLDVRKSVIISSPAGSGKTEKLARRYIALLEEGSEVEKILCITFTEKAAAEMKQRILSILERENHELFGRIKEKIPLMRISTIHAFCLKILKRFSLELGLDPSLAVMDDLSSRNLWTESVYESLMAEREAPAGFFGMMKDRGLRGWGAVKRLLDRLHAETPYPEMILRSDDSLRRLEGDALRLMEIYRECLLRYKKKKLRKRLLDFTDLEMLACSALSLGAEAHNILHSFDEHTDHVLVDEFQDTSTLQWEIIDRLTEEWRAGMGAKREAGKTPTIFLVGDEKQSIYLFRGANVSMFQEAKERFVQWLGGEFNYVEARDNYRSLPAIVNFTNLLFERLMPPTLVESWITRYSPFEAVREGEGRVELILLEGEESTKETRLKEAMALARAIKSLHRRHEVYGEDGRKRPCGFADMAILLRRRTHLGLFEDAMREHGIPFIVLKGIGFYEEPEVAMLREFISFMVDPADDYSLFCLLRSPLFGVDYPTLTRLIRGKGTLLEGLRNSTTRRLKEIAVVVDGWSASAPVTPLAVMLERVLLDTGGWAHFWERQRYANIKKFIAMVEGMDSQGLSPIEIREKLLRRRDARDEAKANINAEGMDAVKVMTIHAAKGLQFPMVFLPCMEEKNDPRSGPIVMDDAGGRPVLAYEEDSRKRARDERFRRRKLKEQEEEKRLFYVAVTRTRDYLCMIGSRRDERLTGRLSYLEDAFDLSAGKTADLPLGIVREEELEARYRGAELTLAEAGGFMSPPAYTDPLRYEPERVWKDVTEVETEAIRVRRGENRVLTGTVMHRLFEELSTGALKEEDILMRAEFLLRAERTGADGILGVIIEEMDKLRESGLMEEVILPRENAHTELPFVLEKEGKLYRGRIDRVILEENAAYVYDYKTFPVRDREMPEIMNNYGFQMSTYAEAAERLFRRPARAYMVFTHVPRVVEVKIKAPSR